MKIEKQLKKIVIHHHLGMGDAIECNGMVRFFAEKYDIVDIFAKHNYYDATAFMYRDTDKIVVNKIDGGKEYQEVANFLKSYDGEVLIPGHVNYFNNLDFFKKMQYSPGRAFYHLADVPWKFRNEKFKIQRDPFLVFEERFHLLKIILFYKNRKVLISFPLFQKLFLTDPKAGLPEYSSSYNCALNVRGRIFCWTDLGPGYILNIHKYPYL